MAKQQSLKISKTQHVPIRIRSQIASSDGHHTKLLVWVNGDLTSGDSNAISLRNADVVPFMMRLQPEIIIVRREYITDDLWKRIKHLKVIELI